MFYNAFYRFSCTFFAHMTDMFSMSSYKGFWIGHINFVKTWMHDYKKRKTAIWKAKLERIGVKPLDVPEKKNMKMSFIHF